MSDRSSAYDPLSHPDRIGPYRILQVLGEGGMGVVYEAEQVEPVRRRVALKVVKAGMDTRDVVARFEAERQALAVMSHPGIAKVLDAGATEAGLPYFVMEVVRGVPITTYCDREQLGVRERLRLFVAVCEAVQHAHQKGVIHRDLKPSNVLVAEVDGRPEPKIIDFGIAKATGQRLTEKTLVTMHGQALGTAAYMSPEQAEMSGLDIDTRTDVYSLGVMLYELLVGQLPTDPDQVGVIAFIAQLVSRDTDVPTPSTRYSTTAWNRDRLAKLRHTDPENLHRVLAHDLDWIVMKAMEKDRAQRYETANALAADIERYLADEPISARPPTLAYRMRKFARRHRTGVVAGVVVLFAVVGGGVATGLGFVRARTAEAAARQDAATSREVSDFLVNLFRVSQPGVAMGNTVTARSLLDSGAVRVSRQLAGQPLVAARMLHTMGRAYEALGLYDRAAALLDTALQFEEHALGSHDTTVAATLRTLGEVERFRGDYPAAERRLSTALAIDSAGGAGARALHDDLRALAVVHILAGKTATGESLLVRAIHTDSTLPQRDSLLVQDFEVLGIAYYNRGKYDQATEWLQRALDGALRQHQDLTAAVLYNDLGGIAFRQQDYNRALAMYEKALPIFERIEGPNHPDVATALRNIAEVDHQFGRNAEADSLARRALAMRNQNFAPGSPVLAQNREFLAEVLRDEGPAHYAEADSLFRGALPIMLKTYGDKDRDVISGERAYAKLLRLMGRTKEAEALEARFPPIPPKPNGK